MDSLLHDIQFQNEINRNLAKFYKVHYFTYVPTWKVKPLAGKPYSRHEGEDPVYVYEDMLNIQMRRFKRTDKIEAATTNQEYGLNRKPILEVDTRDRRFFHGRFGCEITKIETLIRQARGQLSD